MAQLLYTSLFTDPALKAYYRMEVGAITADARGNNILTNNNGANTTPFGKYGGGADFGTSNSNKSLALPSSGLGVNLGSNSSIVMEVRVQTEPGTNSTYRLVDWRSTTGSARSENIQYKDVGGTKQLASGFGGAEGTFATTLGTLRYHHLALTCDGTTGLVYLDGVQVISASSVANPDTDYIYIGSANNGSQASSVFIDEVAFFSKVLTLTEIQTLAADTGSGYLFG